MPNVRNDECIILYILYNFGGRIMCCFEVEDGGYPKPPAPGLSVDRSVQPWNVNCVHDLILNENKNNAQNPLTAKA